MSDGGGGFYIIYAVDSDGEPSPDAKLYHYAAGTTNLKNIYSDEDLQTTLAQPYVSDSAGRFVFYALGDYKFRVDTSADVTLDTWDDVHISKGQPHISDYGTAYPVAAAANKGHSFAKIDGSDVLRGFAINQNTSFVEIYAADANGVRTNDSMRVKNYPWYDITHPEYGAVDGEADNQTDSINSAISDIETAGNGVLFIPEGEFQVDGILNIDNTSIKIMGMGVGKSILKQTADASGAMIDYDSDDVKDTFEISGVSLRTSFAGAGNAIDCNWPTTSSSIPNCTIRDVEITPTDAASGTAYFDNGIVLNDARNAKISNVWINGTDNNITNMTAGIHLVNCQRSSLDDIFVFYGNKGILMDNNCEETQIDKPHINYIDQGISIDFTAAAQDRITVTGGFIEADTYGISMIKCIDSIINGVTIVSLNSTDDFTGIDGDSDTHTITISNNTIRQTGTGTTIGVSLDGDNCLVSNNHIQDQDTGITIDGNDALVVGNFVDNNTSGLIFDTNSNTCQARDNRLENNTTEYTDSGTGNLFLDEWRYGVITLASASTLTIPGYGDVFSITGSTDLDNISASWVGRKIYLIGAVGSGFVIKNKAGGTGNIRTNAALGITVAENDSSPFVYINSAWVEIAIHSGNDPT